MSDKKATMKMLAIKEGDSFFCEHGVPRIYPTNYRSEITEEAENIQLDSDVPVTVVTVEISEIDGCRF